MRPEAWRDVAPEDWNDWRWQVRNAVTDAEGLAAHIPLSRLRRAGLDGLLSQFRMSITPYFMSLIDVDDRNCPIARQCIPEADELELHEGCCADPLEEDRFTPVEGIVHKYPDRALLIYSKKCAVYCRHCTRRRFVGEDEHRMGSTQIDRAIRYIESTPAIRDVLITGGDPLLYSDSFVESIISRVRSIEHVEIIRIGTRVPVSVPMRVTDDLVAMLRKYHPIWINTHFNHPGEITPESIEACRKIVDAGIPLGSQTVLLRGVNDNVDTLRELFTKLVKARVRPYYLYQCDAVQGIGHFRTRIEEGVSLIRQLRGTISGFAMPTFVVDTPSGKIPVLPQYPLDGSDEHLVPPDFQGRESLPRSPIEKKE